MPRAGLSAPRLAAFSLNLADEIGFEQVTLSAVARHFNVQVASLYSHVANLHHLRTQMALTALNEMADEAADAVAGRAKRDALLAFASAYRDYGRGHPGRFAATKYRLEPADAANSAGVRHATMMRSILRGYQIDEPGRTHAVRLLGSTIRGYVELESAGGFDRSPPDSQQSWECVIDALDALFMTWPALLENMRSTDAADQ